MTSLIATLLIMTRTTTREKAAKAAAQAARIANINADDTKWAERVRKRIIYIQWVKESAYYRQPWTANVDFPVPTTPNPYDRSKSKRQWEANCRSTDEQSPTHAFMVKTPSTWVSKFEHFKVLAVQGSGPGPRGCCGTWSWDLVLVRWSTGAQRVVGVGVVMWWSPRFPPLGPRGATRVPVSVVVR